jgi:hypothetical protein
LVRRWAAHLSRVGALPAGRWADHSALGESSGPALGSGRRLLAGSLAMSRAADPRI